MHDIRKPYIRSNSNRDLNSRVEQFETRSYEGRDGYEEREDGPVQIPVRRTRRNVNDMDMYPRRRRDDIYEDEEDTQYEQPSRTRSSTLDQQPRRVRRQGTLGTWLFIIAIILFAGGAGIMTYYFDSATVTIVPKYQDIDVNKTLTFSAKNGDIQTNIPFVVESSSLTKSKTLSLSESKKIESKASGRVIIYNKYDASPQKLIKNTRLESSAGKIYRITQSISVPGKSGDTPGSVEVTVYADSYGADYNSGLTDFTIPGFKGTPREKAFYARSKTPITGGSSGNVSLASLSDLNAAKDELALELAQSLKVEMMKIKKEGYTGLYSASEITYSDNESDVLKGITGTYEVTATGRLLFADSAKMAQTIASGDVRDYTNEPVRLGYVDTLSYTRKETDHIASSTDLAILVQGKPRVIWLTDFDAIKELVRGKKRDEFKPLMKSLTTIVGAEISFSPMWLSTFPSNISKIAVVESLPKR
jgi:hypothetical protein